MRSVCVFPARERSETVALLDQHLPEQRDPWVMAEALYVSIDDDQTGYLFSDWEPDQVAVLEAAVGHRPTWAVGIDLSGRIDGTAEVLQLVALLLQQGGVTVDDYSDHPWTLQEIESGAVINGLRFFDFCTMSGNRQALEFPFHGSVVWLTPEQGGRATGPPVPRFPGRPYFAATAYVPPRTAATGLASFVLRGFNAGEWRSPAEGRWLIVANDGEQLVENGSVVVVTEGTKAVAFFTVDQVDRSDR
jgi:hypothetical protein